MGERDSDWINTYTIMLQVDIFDHGLIVQHENHTETFRGIGAFKKCLSYSIGYEIEANQLVNVWDGYFSVNIGTFKTHKNVERKGEYDEVAKSLPILSDFTFQSSQVKVVPKKNISDDENITYVDLLVDPTHEIRFLYHELESLLETIQQHVNPYSWKISNVKDLFVSLGKFRGGLFRAFKTIEFPNKPIKFKCSSIQILSTSKKAQKKYLKNKGTDMEIPWWIGAIEIDGKCSACRSVTKNDWQGYCQSCLTVQMLRPLWVHVDQRL